MLVRHGPALLVALIRVRGGSVLALPKGHIEAGESPEQAALRETREETGLVGRTLAPLEEISYVFWSRMHGARVSKRVHFFLLEYRAGSIAHHDGEVEGVRLVPIERAHGRAQLPRRAARDVRSPRLGAGGRLRWWRGEGISDDGLTRAHPPNRSRGLPCTP